MRYETESRDAVAGNDNTNHLNAARALAYDSSHVYLSRGAGNPADKLDPTFIQQQLDSGTHSTADIYKTGGRAPSGRPDDTCGGIIVDGPGPGPCKIPTHDKMPSGGGPHPPVDIPTQQQRPVIVGDR
ncbi:MAG: hypothetical protein JSS83_16445 [Cyanobacteria bacterium SZAS LIN-3]|nr:hypothetical protein [Cyanobacteria bacterium SZAS LIN-3]